MSKGSKNVIVRFPQDELDAMLRQMAASNVARTDEPYTVSSFIRSCVRAQLAKNERGRRPCGRRLANRLERESREFDFDNAWDAIALQGACDGRGSAEYARIRNWWHKAGRPAPVEFIARAANTAP